MSEQINDGGPAFPVVETDPRCGTRTWGGMVLRDYFAAQVIGTVIDVSLNTEGSWDTVSCAACAYEVADAMLAARTKEADPK